MEIPKYSINAKAEDYDNYNSGNEGKAGTEVNKAMIAGEE